MPDCKTRFTTKQCLQFHYRKTHNLTDDNMPSIEREIPYTLSAYSGGIADEVKSNKHKKSSSEYNAMHSQVLHSEIQSEDWERPVSQTNCFSNRYWAEFRHKKLSNKKFNKSSKLKIKEQRFLSCPTFGNTLMKCLKFSWKFLIKTDYFLNWQGSLMWLICQIVPQLVNVIVVLKSSAEDMRYCSPAKYILASSLLEIFWWKYLESQLSLNR